MNDDVTAPTAEDALSSSGSLFQEILDAIRDRSKWESKLSFFYEMRHNGLRRKNRQDWQADLHYPLIDMTIAKQKATLLQQIYATDLVAQFTPVDDDNERNVANTCATWFDQQIKQNSNLEDEVPVLIDYMLQNGRTCMRMIWDHEQKQLKFDAIDPLFLVVPYGTAGLQDSPWVAHIRQFTARTYAEQDQWNQDEEFVASITGNQQDANNTAGLNQQQNTKALREGITSPSNNLQIIVWEVYVRQEEGILVHTFSPSRPDEPVRPDFIYNDLEQQYPFVEFENETKEKGFYSARGVAEHLAPIETYLSKCWNEKADCMTLYNRPLFYTEAAIPNAGNIRMTPGQILPFQLQRVDQGAPPMDFDQEMQSARAIAEQLEASADLGIAQAGDMRENRTATEVSAITAMAQQGSDMRTRLFRRSLGMLYRMAWTIYLKYGRTNLQRFIQKQNQMLPVDQVPVFEINPRGSADGVNKPYMIQKAIARFQLLKGDPYVDQAKLVKMVLEVDDSGLVSELFTNPQQVQADQAESQAIELTIMKDGFPAPVHPYDDDQIHCQTLSSWVDQQLATKQAIDPTVQHLILQHFAAHVQQAMQRNPVLGRQIAKALQAKNKQWSAAMSQAHHQAVASPLPAAPAVAAPSGMGNGVMGAGPGRG